MCSSDAQSYLYSSSPVECGRSESFGDRYLLFLHYNAGAVFSGFLQLYQSATVLQNYVYGGLIALTGFCDLPLVACLNPNVFHTSPVACHSRCTYVITFIILIDSKAATDAYHSFCCSGPFETSVFTSGSYLSNPSPPNSWHVPPRSPLKNVSYGAQRKMLGEIPPNFQLALPAA